MADKVAVCFDPVTGLFESLPGGDTLVDRSGIPIGSPPGGSFSLPFDGVDDKLNSTVPITGAGSTWSIMMWINLSKAGGYNGDNIISVAGTISNAAMQVKTTVGGGADDKLHMNVHTSATNPTHGGQGSSFWATAVHDSGAGNFTMYVDTTAGAAGGSTQNHGNGTLHTMANTGGGNELEGHCAACRFYDYALTSGQIGQEIATLDPSSTGNTLPVYDVPMQDDKIMAASDTLIDNGSQGAGCTALNFSGNPFENTSPIPF